MEFNNLLLPFFVSFFGIYLYKRFSISQNILAEPNFRTLHIKPIPSGGGIIFSVVFIISLLYLWWLGLLSDNFFLVLSIGGLAATLFGFLDDLINIGPIFKLVIQFLLSGWSFFWLEGSNLFFFDWLPALFAIPATLLFLVWIINAYNFIDGIDGMAISGALFVSFTIICVLLLTRPDSEFILLLALLFACISSFIFFNWPPASIFMGDSGSIFLGYLFGSIILATVISGELSILTWLVVFGYFFADLVVTQIMRFILVKKWYLAHRSHAYQNLARIKGSHFIITGGVLLFNFTWILPLTLWSALNPGIAYYAVFLAVLPGIVITFIYGPLLSSS